jgi:hypothetical protein
MLSLRMLVMLRLLGCHLHWQASHHLLQRRHFWRPIHDHEGEVHCCRLAPVVMHIVILTHDKSGRRWLMLDRRAVHTVSSTSTWRGLAHSPPRKSSSATPWAQVLGQRRKSVGTKICSISSTLMTLASTCVMLLLLTRGAMAKWNGLMRRYKKV